VGLNALRSWSDALEKRRSLQRGKLLDRHQVPISQLLADSQYADTAGRNRGCRRSFGIMVFLLSWLVKKRIFQKLISCVASGIKSNIKADPKAIVLK
jgi:hypothetical protein